MYLCSKGADLSAVNTEGLNPLYYASSYGQIEVMKWILLQRPDLLNAGPTSPLHKAIENFQIDAVKYLVANNADVMTKASIEIFSLMHVTPLELAVKSGADLETAVVLIYRGRCVAIDRASFHTACWWTLVVGDGE